MLRLCARCGILIVALIATAHAAADTPAGPPIVIKLWDDGPPNAVEGAGPETRDARGSVGNISVPEIKVHLPPTDRATGVALIVCPGGSYRQVGLYDSGMFTIDYFVPRGVAVVVLKYRTSPPSTNVAADALADAQRAVRLVRHNAAAWRLDPQRIGMVGSSAGSHLVLNAATHADEGDAHAADAVERHSSRPDFIGLLCPWPNKQGMDDFPVGPNAPPAFVASARDDRVAPTAFAESIAAAYRDAGVPVHLWVVEQGGHRAFVRKTGEGAQWMDRFSDWLASQGVLPEAQPADGDAAAIFREQSPTPHHRRG